MILRDNTNEYNSLYHTSLRWARTTETLFPFNPDFLQSLNVWVKRVEGLINRYDGRWAHADANLTSEDLIDTINLTQDTQQYAINANWRVVARVRVLENDGVTWKTLENKNRGHISDAEMASSDLRYYYLLGGYLWLAGKPAYSQTNGIEVQFQTSPYPFLPADTDKEVGFDPIFEEIAILGHALDYLDINGPAEQAEKVRSRLGQEPMGDIRGTGLMGALAEAYAERNDTQFELEIERSNRSRGLQLDSVGSDLNPPM